MLLEKMRFRNSSSTQLFLLLHKFKEYLKKGVRTLCCHFARPYLTYHGLIRNLTIHGVATEPILK